MLPSLSDGATHSLSTPPLAAAANVGQGKVVLFGDDLVTHAPQWRIAGTPTTSEYDPCWHETAKGSCVAGQVFQYMQFWYNAIRYASPLTECDFVVKEP